MIPTIKNIKIPRKISAFVLLVIIGTTDSLFDIFVSVDDTALGVLYICCILLVSTESKKVILTVYTMATVFIVIDFVVLLCLNNNTTLSVFLNSCISIMAVSIATYLVIKRNKLEEEKIQTKEEYIQSLEDMLFITSHKVRSPICSLQGIMDITRRDEHASLSEYYHEIDGCVRKMDEFTRELTSFIRDKGEKHGEKGMRNPKRNRSLRSLPVHEDRIDPVLKARLSLMV